MGARRRAVILPIRRRSCWARNALVLTSLISGPDSRARYGSISTSVIRVHGVVAPSTEAQALLAYLMSLKQTAWPANKTAAGPAPAPSEQPATSGVPATQAPAAGMSAAPTTSGYDADKGKHLFSTNCSACHQETGEGLAGAFPPLRGQRGQFSQAYSYRAVRPGGCNRRRRQI